MARERHGLGSSSSARREADLQDEVISLLPAWAFEKMLSRVWRSRKEDGGTVLRLAFPPGTPLVHIWAGFPRYKHLMVQETLMRVFDGWECRVLGQDGADGLPPPCYRHFEVSPTEKRLAYETACLAFAHPDGHEIAALIALDVPEGEDRTNARIRAHPCLARQGAVTNYSTSAYA